MMLLRRRLGQSRHEGTRGQTRTSDTPISVGVYVVSLEGECNPTKVILTWASHPQRDVTGKIAPTSIVAEISDI